MYEYGNNFVLRKKLLKFILKNISEKIGKKIIIKKLIVTSILPLTR